MPRLIARLDAYMDMIETCLTVISETERSENFHLSVACPLRFIDEHLEAICR